MLLRCTLYFATLCSYDTLCTALHYAPTVHFVLSYGVFCTELRYAPTAGAESAAGGKEAELVEVETLGPRP
eukprot:2941773-Rhodomonas_salina.1